MDWLKLIENWFNAWVFYLERYRIRYMTRMEHVVECVVGGQSWHVYAVKFINDIMIWNIQRSELSSERFNAAFSVGHGFVQTSEVLAKIPVLHGYIPMESQEPGEHGIPIWEFLEINSHFCTFLHVHIIHIILRWENKIRCWLPIAGNTQISPGEPCWKRIAGGDRWWLTFCGSSRGRRFCRGVVHVSIGDAVLMIHWWFNLIFPPIRIQEFHTIRKIPQVNHAKKISTQKQKKLYTCCSKKKKPPVFPGFSRGVLFWPIRQAAVPRRICWFCPWRCLALASVPRKAWLWSPCPSAPWTNT